MTDRLTPGQLRDLADTLWPRDVVVPMIVMHLATHIRNEAARREAEGLKCEYPRCGCSARSECKHDAPPPTAPEERCETQWEELVRRRRINRQDTQYIKTLCDQISELNDKIANYLARADAAEAELEKERRIVARREETRRKALLRDIDAALAGDLKPLRLRRDLMLAPPVEIVASNALAGGTDV